IMATAVTPGEEEKGRKRRRSRARARAVALAESAVTIPVAEALPIEPAVEEPSESRLAAAVRVRRRERKQAAALAAVEPAATEATALEREPEEAAPEPFHDLLGQAIGLRLDSVTREFDTGEMKVAALRDVSLEIGPGEFVAVIGPSGCGKTTLLSMMGGLDQPTTGQVYASGVALDQLSDDALADYRLQRVSTIFQTFNLVPGMSAEENVILPLTLAGVEPEERRSRARRLLALVGLEGRSRLRAGRLSGGEQQKVAVARALAGSAAAGSAPAVARHPATRTAQCRPKAAAHVSHHHRRGDRDRGNELDRRVVRRPRLRAGSSGVRACKDRRHRRAARVRLHLRCLLRGVPERGGEPAARAGGMGPGVGERFVRKLERERRRGERLADRARPPRAVGQLGPSDRRLDANLRHRAAGGAERARGSGARIHNSA